MCVFRVVPGRLQRCAQKTGKNKPRRDAVAIHFAPAAVLPLQTAARLWQEKGTLLQEFTMPDFAALRTMMVDTQVRPSDVTKLPIIEAMLSIPRERFAADDKVDVAYSGMNLPIAPGRVLLEARTLGKMLDALDIRRTDLVLDVGCGTGYSSAVLAHMAEAVVAVEPSPSLAEDAAAALESVGISHVAIEQGPAAAGAPSFAPFDVIIIQGGIETLPAALADQLAEGGRIAALFMQGPLGVVRLGVKTAGVIRWRDVFNATAPVLDGFESQRTFAL